MPLHWRPVGPEPASTYWQRRAVLAAAVVLLLALLTTLLGGGDDEPDTLAEAPPTASPAPSADPAASPEPGAEPAEPPAPTPAELAACRPEELMIQPLADQSGYSVGASARLTLKATNTGSTPCTTDLGQAAVELLVFSGRDRIWSSDDCAPGGPVDVTTLQPGESSPRASTWDGRRSLPGCGGGKAQAQPGTYRVHGRVGQQVVEGVVFRITG
jgi:hypothetical protein